METTSQNFQTTKIKFCGITNSEDIIAAENLEVDFIGLIFIDASPRHIKLKKAMELRKNIKTSRVVGVFDDTSMERIQNHLKTLNLDYIQLHGKPNLELCNKFTIPVIQAFKGLPSIEVLNKFLAVCQYILIDKEDGKDQADFQAIAALPENIRSKTFLAGGITPSNVKQLISLIHPFAVDCARGIEFSPGKKNHRLMSSFVSAIRN